jgi:hypothetical protein
MERGANEPVQAGGGGAETEKLAERADVGRVVGVGVGLGHEISHTTDRGGGTHEVYVCREMLGPEQTENRGEQAGVGIERAAQHMALILGSLDLVLLAVEF